MTKRLTAMAVVAGVASMVTGCALTAESDDEQVTIGLAVANQQADFFNQIREAVQAKGEAEGVEIVLADAGGDASRQVSQVQDFITQQVDAIIYIPAGATAASVPVRDAREAGIPVVSVDRNPEDAPGDTFIATDSVAAARELGDWVVEQTGGEGRLGVIQGQIGTTPEIARNEGFEAALEDSNIEEVARQASEGWHQDEGFDIAQDMLQSNPDIDIFFGRADALALGAAQAARGAGYSREDILIVGFDGDVAGLEAVRDGVIDATITQQTQHMGRLAFDSAIQLVNGEDLPAEQLQEGILTTPENVEEFIEEHP
ncbi:substrate-binding domain-containing protein [Georgenia alba]|uniref:Substrate-binding domain-containing protein n=1 Tax=Georgenia alba TaxID=2233858 RepID=A0ABW2Q8A7_9MICO